jgi:protein-S-isoprenylcysteine O-methyltransferase Ste14
MLVLFYALFGYASFIGVMAALVLWMFRLQTPDAAGSTALAFGIDLLLMLMFAVQHTVMARAPFKAWLQAHAPAAAERATYVIASNLALALMMLGWQRLPGMVWTLQGPLAVVLLVIAVAGWIIGVAATFQFDHWSLFGLRQALAHARGRSGAAPDHFAIPSMYRHVRHPMMTGFLLAFWITPQMSVDRLVLAAGLSVYILVGMRFEERSLQRRFGQAYVDYAARTPALLPRPWRRAVAAASVD